MGLDVGISIRVSEWERIDRGLLEDAALQALVARFGVSNGRYCVPQVNRAGRELTISVSVIGHGVPLQESGHEVEEIPDVLAAVVRHRFGIVLVEVWTD